MSEMRLRLLTQRDQKNVALRVVLRPERTHETTADEDLANAFFTENHAALRIEPSRARSGILESQRDQATLRHREERRSTVAENSQLRAAPIALANRRVLRHRRVTADQAARTLELGTVEHDSVGTSDYAWPAKAAAPESLVVEHEVAAIPEEHLHAIASATDEDEQMAGERVETERVLHERVETVMTAAQIDGLRREEHLRAGRERRHVPRTATTRAAT
jgi:hypothetical protein